MADPFPDRTADLAVAVSRRVSAAEALARSLPREAAAPVTASLSAAQAALARLLPERRREGSK